MTTTVNRSDITYVEEVEYAYTNDISFTWTATLDGHLSTGESVCMYRSGPTQPAAAIALAQAIHALSWETR